MEPEEIQTELPLAEPGGEPEPFEAPSAAPSPEEYVSRADYERALADLDQERVQSREARAFVEDAHQRLGLEATVRRELERMVQEHSAQQAAAAQMAPPAPGSVEEWLVEPGQIADYVGRYGEWVRRATLAQIAPFLQRFALYDAVLPAVLTREAEGSMAKAKQMLEEEGATDFDELRPEIEQAFAQNPAGARLMLDPATIASVYHFLARQRGGVRPVREKAQPVPTAGVSRAGSPRAASGAAALSPTLRTVAERLQINPQKLAERLSERLGRRTA